MPVLCLHGFMDHGLTFTWLLEALQWQAEAWDARGFGQSEWLHRAAYYHFFDYLRDLRTWVTHTRQQTGAKQVLLLGHSMGGMIASLYAGIYPEDVAALINLEGWMIPERPVTDMPERLKKWLAQCEDLTPFAVHDDADAARERMLRQDPRLTSEQVKLLSEPILEFASSGVRWRHDPLHRTRSPQPFRLDQAVACWQHIRAPQLLIYGTESPILQLPDWDVRMAAFGVSDPERNVTLRAIENAGHNVHLHQSRRVSEVIKDWWSNL